eukprot:CAMPEP_0172479728 /NCGR_PEP_ID=MMETSP1066-20121228/4505_1 /TAXON_ID=671091 /ORGANISM="Coscinodiscus wailesii, Strain CCMP2513" /LENGTH=46 /DNA_ID= /DNA_START= /DNA_END= /DNA_ORIENTATION=
MEVFGGGGEGRKKSVLDARCGLGAGLMYLEKKKSNWSLTGYTISEY